MAVKKATEGGKKGEKTEPAVGKSSTGNRNLMLIIAAVAIAVVLAIVIFFVASQEAPDGGGSPEGGGGTVMGPGGGTGSSFDEISLKALEAGMRAQKATVDMSATMEVGGEAAQGQEVSLEVSMGAEYDAANKKVYSKSTSSAVGAGVDSEQVVEAYLVGDITYTKIENPYGEDYWIKQSLGYDLWAAMEDIDPSEMLGMVDGQVLGTETKNGRETYKLAVQPDIGAIIEYSMSMYDMGELGGTGAEMDELMGIITDSITKADFTAWVSKEDYKVMALEGEIGISLDLGTLAGVPGMGNVELMMELSADLDYDSPVDVQLPAGALDATDLDSFTEGANTSICGDGLCSYYEDETSCPEDCTPVCGDGWCSYGEDSEGCPEDCFCGNTICELTEDEESCPEDCTSICGDGWCDFDETPETCAVDCYCGNEWCDDTEDSETCPEDCYCGDFWCDSAESIESCPEDCEIVTI